MANNPSDLIQFKRGTSAKLAELKAGKSGIDGSFYLTIDEASKSSRLYVGRADGDIVPVNQGIYTVQTVGDLTASVNNGQLLPGDFAYVTGTAAQSYADGNILAYWTGANWLQLNKVDVADKYLASLTASVTVSEGVATVKITGLDEQGTKGTNNALETAFTVQGANGITASSSGTAITLTGTSYELGSAAVAADSNTANIQLKSKDSASATTAANVGDPIAISTANDDHVHITGAANQILIDAAIPASTTLSNESAGFGLVVADSFGGSTPKSTIDPTITYGGSADQVVHFVNGNATLNAYTKNEIDAKMQALDALEYRGTVGSAGSAATSIGGIPTAEGADGVKVGYVYKLVGSNLQEYTSIPTATGTATAHGGDLLIANSSATPKETDGKIPTDSLYYDIISVEQGEDTTYTWTADASNNKMSVMDSHTNAKGSVQVVAGDVVSVNSTATGNNLVTTIGHAVVNQAASMENNKLKATSETAAAQDTNVDLTFVAVTDVTVDEHGHTTAYKTKSITVKDSKLGSVSESTSVSAANNVATITSTVGAKNADGTAVTSEASGAFKLESDNLTVTAPTVAAGAAPEVKVNFVWGTF